MYSDYTFLQIMYNHYLDLFHTVADFSARSFARRQVTMFGELMGMTKQELAFDKLPRVDFKALFNQTSSIAGDGDE